MKTAMKANNDGPFVVIGHRQQKMRRDATESAKRRSVPTGGTTRTGYFYRRWRGKHLPASSGINGVIYYAYQVAGKRTVVCLHTTDLEEAKRRATPFLNAVAWSDRQAYLEAMVRLGDAARAELQAPPADDVIPLASAWDRYVASRRRPASGTRTLAGYRQQFEAFRSWAPQGTHALHQVTPALAERYAYELDGQHASGTVNAHLTTLRLVWRVLLPRAANPWAGVKSSKRDDRTHYRRLTLDEVKRILAVARGEMRTLCVIGYTTGLRLIDAVLLDWASVDIADGIITLTPVKTRRTGKSVTIPIHPMLIDALGHDGTGPVMPGLAARYRSDPTSLPKLFAEVLKSAKIEAASFHCFRVTWQTLQDEGGTSRVFARAVLGHSSPSMSDTYSRAEVERMRDSVLSAIPPV